MGESAEKSVKAAIDGLKEPVCKSYGEHNSIHGDNPDHKEFQYLIR